MASSGGRPRGAGVAIASASTRSKSGNGRRKVKELGMVEEIHYGGTEQLSTSLYLIGLEVCI